ncbi:uncharacterized protein TRIVIDRAFT_195992 [Trichoderma virens Gv29-8]|uniref:Peptidase S8/S53 domain-containing protein n=1 Tax=Hypocrea virens (strain Gv29-8 / FGSC 10586) TaxID=413071 RepID=G9NBC9_HYPVG|nr:uncharacterized protein TRIVIDRAFT_195992 [Trichoderma virens Gv29-8]EHK16135.1 hypothetical protein TRIVIDRAFT_195992 [Trichoderma virens Gv29-8]
MTKEQCCSTADYINREVRSLETKINKERERNNQPILKVITTTDSWNPTQMRLANLEEMPVKVAIIDNGVLSVSPRAEEHWDSPNHTFRFDSPMNGGTGRGSNTKQRYQDSNGLNDDARSKFRKEAENHKTLWSRIKGGQLDNSRVSPWLFASNPHGTQMANLICAIDPWCDLYVAKVTEGRAGIMPLRVTRLTLGLFYSGIVLLCSTHDEGMNVSEAYPASFRDTITITACDDYGKVLRPANETSFQYKVQGQSVAAGVIPFLDSDDYISGSSVATAITAGLGSLILSCDRIAQRHPRSEQDTDGAQIIKNHLNEMLAKPSKDYILLEKFAGIDTKIQDGRDIYASEIIEKYFGDPKFKRRNS